jgi:hypothetical protein
MSHGLRISNQVSLGNVGNWLDKLVEQPVLTSIACGAVRRS